MEKKLTCTAQHAADDYKRNGVAVVRGALTPYWLEVLREAVDAEVAKGKRYFAYRSQWEREGAFREFCLNSGIGRIAAEVTGSKRISLVFDQLFVKEPGTNTPTGWHSDQPYWPVEGTVVTTWLALDAVDEDNGALEFILGSHAWGVMYRPFVTDQQGAFIRFARADDPSYVDLPDFEAERDKHKVASWNLEPGDMLAFDGHIVHSAVGNRTSTRRRRGYAIRFAGDGATYRSEQGVADWLVDSSLRSGDPLESVKFPVVYKAEQQGRDQSAP